MSETNYGFVYVKEQDEPFYKDMVDDPGPLNPVEQIRYFDYEAGEFRMMNRTCERGVNPNGEVIWTYKMSIELPLTATFKMIRPKMSERSKAKKVILATIRGLSKGKHKLYYWDIF